MLYLKLVLMEFIIGDIDKVFVMKNYFMEKHKKNKYFLEKQTMTIY